MFRLITHTKWKRTAYFNRGLRKSELEKNDFYLALESNKAKALLTRGESSRAEELYLRILDQAETTKESSLLSNIYIGLGDIYLTKKELERSIYYYERSLSAIRNTKLKIFSDESKNRFLFSKDDIYSRLITTYYRMFQNTGEDIYLKKMFYLAEDKKSSSFFETHSLRDKIIESGRFKELIKISEQVENQYLSYLENNLGESRQVHDSKLIEETSLEREIAYSALMSALFKKTELETDTIIPIPHKDVQTDILDEKIAIIEYFLGEKESYVFFLSKTEFHVIPIPSKENIEAAVSGYLNFLSSPEIEAHKAKKAGEEVYSVLLSWMDDTVPNSITDLIIVPDGILNLLPFDTIPKQKSSKSNDINYLIYDYTISTVPSVSLLFHLKETNPKKRYQKELLFVGKSEYKRNRNLISHSPNSQDDYLRNLILNKGFDISDLPYTTSEGKETKKIYQDRIDLLLEEHATKENLLREKVGEYRIIHFACHSLIDNLFPNQSILLLSSSDPNGDFGFLDVKDIIALDIQAELVILSACQTGSGLITSEGIYGFTRAFFLSGAKSVISSLWNIKDKTTNFFMSYFHRSLFSGNTKAQSIRAAKLKLLNSKKTHPFYWGGFQLAGDYF